MLVRNCVKDWPDNAKSFPPCMPSVVYGPREKFGSSTVKIEGMNDARNQKWEEKKYCKVRTVFSSATLYFTVIWLQGLFHCPSQTYPGA